jgi:hypothetical protein
LRGLSANVDIDPGAQSFVAAEAVLEAASAAAAPIHAVPLMNSRRFVLILCSLFYDVMIKKIYVILP